jgi:hypothetical protein
MNHFAFLNNILTQYNKVFKKLIILILLFFCSTNVQSQPPSLVNYFNNQISDIQDSKPKNGQILELLIPEIKSPDSSYNFIYYKSNRSKKIKKNIIYSILGNIKINNAKTFANKLTVDSVLNENDKTILICSWVDENGYVKSKNKKFVNKFIITDLDSALLLNEIILLDKKYISPFSKKDISFSGIKLFFNQYSTSFYLKATFYFILFLWVLSLIRQLYLLVLYKRNPLEIIDRIIYIENNPDKIWLLDLNKNNPDLAEYYWNWQKVFQKSNIFNSLLMNNYKVNKREAKEINESIKLYNDYMNSDVDPEIITKHNHQVKIKIKEWESKNNKKVGVDKFDDFDSLFLDYYNNEILNQEDGEIEKKFKKNKFIRGDIWKKFDKNISKIKNSVNDTAVKFLKEKGIHIPILNEKPLKKDYYIEMINVLNKYKIA